MKEVNFCISSLPRKDGKVTVDARHVSGNITAGKIGFTFDKAEATSPTVVHLDLAVLKDTLSAKLDDNVFQRNLLQAIRECYKANDNESSIASLHITDAGEIIAEQFCESTELQDYVAEHFEESVRLSDYVTAIFDHKAGAYRLHCTKTFSRVPHSILLINKIKAGTVGGLLTNLNSYQGNSWVEKGITVGPNVVLKNSFLRYDSEVEEKVDVNNSIIINSIVRVAYGIDNSFIVDSNLTCWRCADSAVSSAVGSTFNPHFTVAYLPFILNEHVLNAINEHRKGKITVSLNHPFKSIATLQGEKNYYIDLEGNCCFSTDMESDKDCELISEEEFYSVVEKPVVRDPKVDEVVAKLHEVFKVLQTNFTQDIIPSWLFSKLLNKADYNYSLVGVYYKFVATYLRKENTKLVEEYLKLAEEWKR